MSKKFIVIILFGFLVLLLTLFVDYKSMSTLDFKNPAAMSYSNVLKHANSHDIRAQYLLGSIYLNGHPVDAVKIDKEKAMYWFKKAADQKHPVAAFEYARLTSDIKEAELYHRQAVAGGFVASILALAQIKLKEGSPESIKEGLALLYNSAKSNDPMGMAFLAQLLYQGAGIQKDSVAAVLWMQKAISVAPTEDAKNKWTAQHELWFNALTDNEQNKLNGLLMTGGVDAPQEETPFSITSPEKNKN